MPRKGPRATITRPEFITCDYRSRRGKGCHMCENQSWRRPRNGLCECGKSYAPEQLELQDGAARRDEPLVKF